MTILHNHKETHISSAGAKTKSKILTYVYEHVQAKRDKHNHRTIEIEEKELLSRCSAQSGLLREFVMFILGFFASSLAIKGRDR